MTTAHAHICCVARSLSAVLAVFVLMACEVPDMVHSRGIVREIDPGPPKRLVIEHEAIPGFKGRDGNTSTMPSMKMAFELSPSVKRTDVKVGDAIAILFAVHYDDGGRLTLHGITKLKEGTELHLGAGQKALGHEGAEGQQGAHQ